MRRKVPESPKPPALVTTTVPAHGPPATRPHGT